MFTKLCEQLKPYLQDELYKNRARKFLALLKKIMNGPTCLVCGGYGYPCDEMKCGTVKTCIFVLKKIGCHADANLFKKELKLQLLSYKGRVGEQEINEASVEGVLQEDDTSESSNSKAKKLAKKLRKKSDQAHKMASDCALDDVDCVQDNVLMNNSLIAQKQDDDISKNCKRRRLIKMSDLSDDS